AAHTQERAATDAEVALARLRDELSSVKQERDELKIRSGESGESSLTLDTLRTKLAEAGQYMFAAKSEIAQLKQNVQTATDELYAAKASVAEHQRQLDEMKAHVARGETERADLKRRL